MPGDYNGLVDMAWERYHMDPLFHARVYHAVASVKQEAVNNGFTWPESFDGILKAAGAVALLMPEIHDPDTGEFNGMADAQGLDHGDRQRDHDPVSEATDELDG